MLLCVYLQLFVNSSNSYEQEHFLSIADVSFQFCVTFYLYFPRPGYNCYSGKHKTNTNFYVSAYMFFCLYATVTHTHTQGVVLVYEITSKASFDLVTSLRQRVSVKNRDVSWYSSNLGAFIY